MRLAPLLFGTLLTAAVWPPSLTGGAERDAPADYQRDVKPLLTKKCYACHGALKQNAGLRLDTAAGAKKGGDSGAAIVPGNPAESLIVQAVTGEAGFRMPPESEGEPLSEKEIALIAAWIAAGAAAPDDEAPQADPKTWWSYRPMRRPGVPPVNRFPAGSEAERSDPGALPVEEQFNNPMDAFLEAERARRGLRANPPAPRETLLRRIYFDLIGLPPTRDELRAFLADESPDAYERVVDDLLSRPQYGERWGRHWMDVWRYSDWYGRRDVNEIRYSQRHIWRWRDWIIESLNEDRGYDRMVVEMLAGDELAPGDPDTLRATGFLGRNWYKFNRNVWMFETVEQTGQAFLSLTLRCCRCHDHKYDPILQEEYYRFRAFFEPHDVRTDPIGASMEKEKDSALGEVLKDGVARVYDKTLDAPTYIFRRGDDRYPIEDRPLTPGAPAALAVNGETVEIQPTPLPVEAFYPALRPEMIDAALQQADNAIAQAKAALAISRDLASSARKQRDSFEADQQSQSASAWLADRFSAPRPDVWQIVNGDWRYENDHLVQSQVTDFATLVTRAEHPADFRLRLRYRTLAPGGYRSVGFSFDFLDQGNSQDVYTSTGDARQSVQAFHRTGGQQVYPPQGIVPANLRVNEETTLEAEVRGSSLTIWLNGERKLDYMLPIPRRSGKFALWVHNGAAEFLEVELRELRPTLADARRAHLIALHEAAANAKRVALAEAERDALAARHAAEQAKYATPRDPNFEPLARAAGRAERQTKTLQAELEVLLAEQQLALLNAHEPQKGEADGAAAQTTQNASPTTAEAEKQLAEAKQKLAEAQAALAKEDPAYSPLGDVYPQTSTGRRLALARWIASPHNPRTARVAVNHIWLRHFGEALVPTVENFGLNGRTPSHPELLDWLAVELVENGWSMKHIHRLIVTSEAYRRSSKIADFKPPIAASNSADASLSASESPRSLDSENRYLWRMNARRLEAEAVRDAALAAAGLLDLAHGGPEFPETDGQTVCRRSVYFRTTPNARMAMLDLFDAADPNACYRRRESVTPQQALAMSNSELLFACARTLAEKLTHEVAGDSGETAEHAFLVAAFETVLSRQPTEEELAACLRFLDRHAKLLAGGNLSPFSAGPAPARPPAADPRIRARENLIHVLFSHNDFVTVR